MITDLNGLAKSIIAENQYMTIASSDAVGSPWASPVVYAYDDAYNFYFISLPDAKHSINAKLHANATVSIFDSHQNFGEGVGLQIEGTVSEVALSRYPFVAKTYLGRKWPYANNVISAYLLGFQNVLKNKVYKVYVFKPVKIWMNNPNEKLDVRVEITLDI